MHQSPVIGAVPKKPYRQPQLKTHGGLRHLTNAGTKGPGENRGSLDPKKTKP
jgi:hypothetical protein